MSTPIPNSSSNKLKSLSKGGDGIPKIVKINFIDLEKFAVALVFSLIFSVFLFCHDVWQITVFAMRF